MSDIGTMSNSLAISIDGLYDTAQTIAGFAPDDMAGTDAVAPTEIMLGVDGFMSSGAVPYTVPLHITLMADSPSNELFETWLDAQTSTNTTYKANVVFAMPGIGTQMNMSGGVLTQSPPFSDAKKLMQPRKYTITFSGKLVTRTPI